MGSTRIYKTNPKILFFKKLTVFDPPGKVGFPSSRGVSCPRHQSEWRGCTRFLHIDIGLSPDKNEGDEGPYFEIIGCGHFTNNASSVM